MSTPIPLRRRRSDLDATDPEAVRDAILTEVQNEIILAGEPRPRIVLIGDEFTETLDLTTVAKTDPGADLGATFQVLGERPGVEHRFLIFRLQFSDGRRDHQAAMVVHVYEDELLGAILMYQTDPRTGLGQPEPAWRVGDREGLGPFWPTVQPLVEPAPGSRPANLVPAGRPAPEMGACFGELPPDRPLPEGANQLADLAGLISRDRILREGLDGPQVVRFAGRAWEAYLLGPELPSDLDDMIRYLCARDPKADGVALLQLALFPGDGPPQPGLQVVAEQAGKRFEMFGFLEFPEGPAGPKQIGRIVGREVQHPGEGEGWLGVDVDLGWELIPLGGVE